MPRLPRLHADTLRCRRCRFDADIRRLLRFLSPCRHRLRYAFRFTMLR